MTHRLLTAFALLFFLTACQRDTGYHLSRPQMEAVLTDVQLAEVYSTMVKKDSTHSEGLKDNDSLAAFYKQVFQHHDITAAQFNQSLDWYRTHPEELDSVYNGVMRRLDKYERPAPDTSVERARPRSRDTSSYRHGER